MRTFQLYFNLSYDFDDGKVNHLLGLDEGKEIALAVAHVFGADDISNLRGEDVDRLPEDIMNASRVSKNETDYPVIKEIHEAGSKISSKKKTESPMIHKLGVTPNSWEKILPLDAWPDVMTYPDAVFNRRSRRNFVKQVIPRRYIMAMLDSLCLIENNDYHQTISIGFLATHIEDLASGFYLLDTDMKSIGMITPGSFMERMAHICLDQAWLSNAAVHFLFLTNFDLLDGTWGARGYRYAMMTAGRLGERLYLIATAMGLGCCGIGAFYDLEAVELLSLNNASRLLYLVAVGPVKTNMGLR
jgi:SagB-type dehydrogenase family enzyme